MEYFKRDKENVCIMSKIKKILKKSSKIPVVLLNYFFNNGLCKFLPDEVYLNIMFRIKQGKWIDLDEPKSFNEKIQWLKMRDRNPRYHELVDKYGVREYIKNTIGEQYLIPLLGVWDKFDDIDFELLPEKFVLKCTHDSGGVYICRDKSKINYRRLKKFINRHMKKNYYYSGREWVYKDVKPRIIAEQYMVDESEVELKDYKIFSFDGIPFMIQVDYDRFVEHKRNLYTTEWEYIPAMIQYPTDSNHIIPKPECLDELLDLSGKLSKGFAHLRTDFYCINGKIYFGELTFYHGSGFEKFSPKELGYEMGDKINLALAYGEGGKC